MNQEPPAYRWQFCIIVYQIIHQHSHEQKKGGGKGVGAAALVIHRESIMNVGIQAKHLVLKIRYGGWKWVAVGEGHSKADQKSIELCGPNN